MVSIDHDSNTPQETHVTTAERQDLKGTLTHMSSCQVRITYHPHIDSLIALFQRILNISISYRIDGNMTILEVSR